MKKTAQAPANIAFIKYWGKRDEDLRLPLNSSISMNLSAAYTVTTVEFSSTYESDSVVLLDGIFSDKEKERTIRSLDRIRQRANVEMHARVVTQNTFPKGTGAAASASGFAALTIASFASLGVKLAQKELTIFARMGSGSACRSIPDGFVLWEKGETSDASYAYSLYPPEYWDIRDALVIVDTRMKKVSTTEGMDSIGTSPLLHARLAAILERIDRCTQALARKDFAMLGEVIEQDCLDMHHVMQTQVPPLIYWNDETKKIMEAVTSWRKSGVAVYFTIDAGPNVHLIYEGKDEEAVLEKVKTLSGVQQVIVNTAAAGAHLVDTHLF